MDSSNTTGFSKESFVLQKTGSSISNAARTSNKYCEENVKSSVITFSVKFYFSLRLQPGTVFVPRFQIYIRDLQHSRNPTSSLTKANLCLIQGPLWESFTVITNITVRMSELGQTPVLSMLLWLPSKIRIYKHI